jgi:GGDEF domain-containing protein
MREQDCVARWGGEEFLFIYRQHKLKVQTFLQKKSKKNCKTIQ